MKQWSLYHKVLRVSLVVCACVLVFDSGLVTEKTAYLSENAHSYMANSIGMSAAVEPTELNQYTAALTKKERDLNEREAALTEREIQIGLATEEVQADVSTYVLASILFVLLVLIILNYALDYLRIRKVVAQV